MQTLLWVLYVSVLLAVMTFYLVCKHMIEHAWVVSIIDILKVSVTNSIIICTGGAPNSYNILRPLASSQGTIAAPHAVARLYKQHWLADKEHACLNL